MLFHCSFVLALECAHLGVVDSTFGLQVDSLTTLLKRKLCALALCILLALREPQILDRLEQIISICTSVLHETEEDKNGVASGYDYHIVDDGSMGPEESEASRKRQVPAVQDFPYMCLVLHVSFWKRKFPNLRVF
jgi:hypothetical protein